MYRLEGGSLGFQLGGTATDFVLLIMNERGADAAAAAGPKGRTAEAATDVTMRAEILTYSRSRGLFAGVSLAGSTLRPDNDSNRKIYRRSVEAREILRAGTVSTPAAGKRLVDLLNQQSPKNLSD